MEISIAILCVHIYIYIYILQLHLHLSGALVVNDTQSYTVCVCQDMKSSRYACRNVGL